MAIRAENRDLDFTIYAAGWMDTEAAPALGAEIAKISQADTIVLDFRELEYISSSGLRQVVSAYKKALELEAEFAVINVSGDVMEVFRLTNLDRKMRVLPPGDGVE